MKATFKTFKIEFKGQSSQLLLSVGKDLVKVVDITNMTYDLNDFKVQASKLFKQPIKSITFC